MTQKQEENDEKKTRKDCSLRKCSVSNIINTLICNTCKLRVHYDCTLLPLYQLTLFLTNGYSDYTCFNCVSRLFNLSTEDPSEEAKTNQELRIALQDLKSENKIYKVENKKLSGRLKEQARKLDKLNEIHNGCIETEQLETKINDKIEEKIRNVKQSITTQIANKIKEMGEKQMKNLRNTYACVAKKNICTIGTDPESSCDIRLILQEEMNYKMTEDRERTMHSHNIIIHNMAESSSSDDKTENKNDEVAVCNLLQAIQVRVSFNAAIRIGKAETHKIRPMKVIFKSIEDKERVMNNLVNLKNQLMYNSVSITEDYTLEERQLIKQLLQKAKERNQEAHESKYIWKVRGTPRSGLKLKKFHLDPNIERRTL